MVFNHFRARLRRPKKRLRLECRPYRGNILACIDAPLQLADPIPARTDCQGRIVLQVLLEIALVELLVVKGRETRSQAPESPYEFELCRNDVYNETEPRFSREFEMCIRDRK